MGGGPPTPHISPLDPPPPPQDWAKFSSAAAPDQKVSLAPSASICLDQKIFFGASKNSAPPEAGGGGGGGLHPPSHQPPLNGALAAPLSPVFAPGNSCPLRPHKSPGARTEKPVGTAHEFPTCADRTCREGGLRGLWHSPRASPATRASEHRTAPKCKPPASTPSQGFFRIIKNQGGGGGFPKTPSPPPQTKVTIAGKNGKLQPGKSGQAIFGTPSFGSKTPSPLPPPPPLKRSPAPSPLPLRQAVGGGCQKRFGAVTVSYKCHRSRHLASGGQWLGIGWVPWTGATSLGSALHGPAARPTHGPRCQHRQRLAAVC